MRFSKIADSGSDAPIGYLGCVKHWVDGTWSVMATDGYSYTPEEFSILLRDQERERGGR